MAWNSATVRLDPHAGETTTRSDLLAEAKGWLLFFKGSWVPAPDLDQELHTRRALMERWAAADQSFRDVRIASFTSDPQGTDSSSLGLCSPRAVLRAISAAEDAMSRHPPGSAPSHTDLFAQLPWTEKGTVQTTSIFSRS
ncbi:uncharacterized protein ACLA_062910 [Aspergillus clavatus NRRL 1]|uniref:Uncharacterized protein n=1 Tax=Aspergillus clavatus (strain ATCC 1007 / CBS 513.65 / DSM 816 / NCTC 3887 / NRRL 1 / QM 1276 / 107) TaxID=344612 RepID=A1CCR7_ASPCL|nr:uncharacterized protein ACLA_062910 [Aspergillus clavatus NRRL 1]EAW12324.1 hypothetical protein ACLA_062910 [Aspergillus clavatus NRRL 1]